MSDKPFHLNPESFGLTDKPPIGVTPEKMWHEQRIVALSCAIHDYIGQYGYSDNSLITLQWAGEMCTHIEYLNNWRKQNEAEKAKGDK